MAKRSNWSDDFWIMVLQLYLSKPVGIKDTYCREAVALCLELHVHPEELHQRMEQLDALKLPKLERLWETYAWSPKKLTRAVALMRQMYGFGNSDLFYDGVEVHETFERDFRPLQVEPELMPIMLVIILELYFRLTPNTMVKDTPEVAETAKLLKINPQLVVEVLEAFQGCDPYLNEYEMTFSYLTAECADIWQRYANLPQEKLIATAKQLARYFTK